MRAIRDRTAFGPLSERGAVRRWSFDLPNTIPVRLRRLDRRLSCLTALLRGCPPGEAGASLSVYQRVSDPVGLMAIANVARTDGAPLATLQAATSHRATGPEDSLH